MESVKRIHHRSDPDDKVALFRSLFRRRDDVYPRRFESRKTGKSGSAPACANEWVKGVCEKPRIKCAECPHRRFLPVTDEVIRHHLSGQDGNGWDFTLVRTESRSTYSRCTLYRSEKLTESLVDSRLPFYLATCS
jgi:hypothetical protein